VCKKLIKNSQPLWKNFRKPQGGIFLTHTVVVLSLSSDWLSRLCGVLSQSRIISIYNTLSVTNFWQFLIWWLTGSEIVTPLTPCGYSWAVIWSVLNIVRTNVYQYCVAFYSCTIPWTSHRLAYQIRLYLTGFTHCALDYFACVRFICSCFHCLVLYVHACCIIVTWWDEPGWTWGLSGWQPPYLVLWHCSLGR